MPIAVSLEVAEDGTCLGHGPLVGCVVRGRDRADILAAMPGAVERLIAWHARHGVAVEPSVDLVGPAVVVEEQADRAPVRRGDRAALFQSDLRPVGRDELGELLALAGFARADLLALVRDLPDDVLDRPTDAERTTIRAVLRHVGNAGEWYVSRIVPPETLPPEWADDERLPITPFLEMEDRTSRERLRHLTDAELATVVTQPRWTAHPDEPWTARKALRRRIEHELEHLEQIATILNAGDGATR
jgi:hypothetical protein